MNKKSDYQRVSTHEQLFSASGVIAAANKIVADRFGLTPENASTNPAFMTPDRLAEQTQGKCELFLLVVSGVAVGTIGIEAAPDNPDLWYIERLAVLPEEQGNGYGVALMNFAHAAIRDRGAHFSSVAIINENTELKAWYSKLGYEETGKRVFEHLPFTVCFMKKGLS
ncbi:MAG: GNAT family N-acetyltransferase [Bacteroidales bacterium]|nr:GNAT family N-acetyltransferase [Bacteroidales bacterium]